MNHASWGGDWSNGGLRQDAPRNSRQDLWQRTALRRRADAADCPCLVSTAHPPAPAGLTKPEKRSSSHDIPGNWSELGGHGQRPCGTKDGHHPHSWAIASDNEQHENARDQRRRVNCTVGDYAANKVRRFISARFLSHVTPRHPPSLSKQSQTQQIWRQIRQSRACTSAQVRADPPLTRRM